MKERPIIFSGPMVRATLEGRKTETRRPMKPQPSAEWSPHGGLVEIHKKKPDGTFFEPWRVMGVGACNEEGDEGYVSRRGVPGDRLWVRETHSPWESGQGVLYRADADTDGTIPYLVSTAGGYGGGVGNARVDRWTPSIHMPRWASRIDLLIEDVRVERLCEITEEGAKAEGFDNKLGFGMAWTEIYHEKFPLTSDPWVWVYRFSVVGAEVQP